MVFIDDTSYFFLLFVSLRNLYIIFASDNLGDYQELRWLIRNGLKDERKTVYRNVLLLPAEQFLDTN